MKVAAIQHDIAWENANATYELVRPMIAGAVACGPRLVVLTEMFSVGFTMRPEELAEPNDGPSTAFLVDQARTHNVWVCASIPILASRTNANPVDADHVDADYVAGANRTTTHGNPETRAVNRLVLAAPNGNTHTYDKIHPFSYGGEDKHYAPGSSFLTVDIEGLRTSFFVCYDLRFADEFWQLAKTTDCFVIPANWPEVRRHHWQSLLVSRAIENQAYVVGVNRVGDGGGLAYCGDSRIIDPLGEILASGARTPAILVAEVNPETVAATRDRYRFLQDRRTF
jgi:predicted amidohydrolase